MKKAPTRPIDHGDAGRAADNARNANLKQLGESQPGGPKWKGNT